MKKTQFFLNTLVAGEMYEPEFHSYMFHIFVATDCAPTLNLLIDSTCDKGGEGEQRS